MQEFLFWAIFIVTSRLSRKPFFMKTILLATSILLLNAAAYAQQTASRSSELGLMGESNITGNAIGQTSLAGLQYKHYGKKNIGYRVFAGFGAVQQSDYNNFYLQSGDTSIERRASIHASMPMVGGGIEGQHPLYKHVYMFAAFEVRGGYGSGNVDTSVTRHYPDNLTGLSHGYVESATAFIGPKANMLFIGFSPVVGIKVQFNRIAFGTEFSNAVSYMRSNKIPGSQVDFDMGNINERFFLSYRF